MTRAKKFRNSERGFALILALVLAILYFGFIELLMMDASRELAEARRFRSRIVGLTLAENGAELAARNMVNVPVMNDSARNEEGIMSGAITVDPVTGDFDLVGNGQSFGRESTKASVHLEGRIIAGQVTIFFSRHTQ
jgi:hypothetical protein